MKLERGAERLLHQMLDRTKVVILEGGRGVGKTTLARHVGQARGFGSYFDLSDPADRSVLRADPHRVLEASPKPVMVDEAQLEPELPVAVKRLVDSAPQAGQVLLTGSARIGRGALGGSDPLAGRAVRIRLNPFTQSELAGRPMNRVEEWWSGEPKHEVHPETSLGDLYGRILVGGLPAVAIENLASSEEASERHGHFRRILTAYVSGVLTVNLAGTRVDQTRLLLVYRYLASNPGQILNVRRAASELGMRAETVQSYLDLCESNFLLDVAPAYRPSQHKTVTAHPRVFASDVGLAAWAAETSARQLVRDTKLSGSLLENFVAAELQAQAGWSVEETVLMHWRDSRASKEVDLVMRHQSGGLIGVEVKSSSSVSLSDARGLEAFRDAVGERLVWNVIVYTGRVVQQLDDRTWAVPVASFFGNNLATGSV